MEKGGAVDVGSHHTLAEEGTPPGMMCGCCWWRRGERGGVVGCIVPVYGPLTLRWNHKKMKKAKKQKMKMCEKWCVRNAETKKKNKNEKVRRTKSAKSEKWVTRKVTKVKIEQKRK